MGKVIKKIDPLEGVTKCERCGEAVDRSAYDLEFAIITIHEESRQHRVHLCDACVPALEVFLLGDVESVVEAAE